VKPHTEASCQGSFSIASARVSRLDTRTANSDGMSLLHLRPAQKTRWDLRSPLHKLSETFQAKEIYPPSFSRGCF